MDQLREYVLVPYLFQGHVRFPLRLLSRKRPVLNASSFFPSHTLYSFFKYCIHLKLPILLRSMSSSTASRVDVYRDFILSMLSLFCGRLYPTLHPPPADLTGKTAIVTGANSGLGFQIALDLARQNATVYLACRNASKAEEAVSQITSAVPDSVDRVKVLLLDTSSLSSVRECAEGWKNAGSKIDILVHNAGVPSSPGQSFSADGFPTTYATNFLGSFLLTQILEPSLSNEARIIFTSSTGHYISDFTPTFSLGAVRNRLEPGFHAPNAAVHKNGSAADSTVYGNTKAMQIAFAKLLQSRWDAAAKASGRTNERVVHAFSPGFTKTPGLPKMTPLPIWKMSPLEVWEDRGFWLLGATTVLATDVSQGAATAVWLATTKDEAVAGKGMGGGYWERMTKRAATVDLMSTETLERFWIRWEADAGITWR